MKHLSWHSCCQTLTGTKRPENQDSYCELEKMGLWMIADGMGGHHGGEFASHTVADAFADYELKASIDDAVADCHQRLQTANSKILLQRAEANQMMGTTAIVLLFHGTSWVCLWAGDSRCYQLSDGKLHLLTRDHNLLQDAIARGQN